MRGKEEIFPNTNKKIAENPIIIPANPYWEVFRRFGKDEAVAMVINVLGAAAADYALHKSSINTELKNLTLAAVGPIIEKVGFFPMHFKEAWELYSTTPKEERKRLMEYIKNALKSGGKSLLEDVLVHDPIYIALMYFGLKYNPTTPAYVIATTSFIAAVLAVAGLEVSANEISYLLRKLQLKRLGFGLEPYYEARFFIRGDQDPQKIITHLAQRFNLSKFQKGVYTDRYLETTLPAYSGRTARVRLRQRKVDSERKIVQTAQIVYTRSSEISKKELSQFRYFPQRKEKFYFFLNQVMPKGINEIKDQRIRKMLMRYTGNKINDVHFTRLLAHDPKTLLIALDCIRNIKTKVYVLEIKVHNQIKLLKEAMRYVMLHYPVIQTTYGKGDLFAI